MMRLFPKELASDRRECDVEITILQITQYGRMHQICIRVLGKDLVPGFSG